MSSLQQALKDRAPEPQGDATRLCAGIGSSHPALVVNLFSGKRWAFTWSYFIGVEFEKGAECDHLVLRFTHYEILVEGRHLAGLVDDFAIQRVEYLRDLPDRFALEAQVGAPFIARLQVRPVDAAPSNPANVAFPERETDDSSRDSDERPSNGLDHVA